MDTILPNAVCDVLDSSIQYVYSLEPLFAPTVVLVPNVVREQVLSLSEAIGFDVDTLNYTLGMFLCYPLGLIMTSLPYGKIRHLFSFLLGAWLLQFTIGVQWIHHVISCVVAYAMILLLPPKMLKTALPVFAMMYITLGHLHRQYVNYLGYDLDFTGPQMVLTQKLYMLAYNIYDGHELAAGKENRASKKCAKFAVKTIPTFLEFLGYMFCFSNILAGPAYEFTNYCSTCDGSLLYTADGKPRGKIPSNVWPTLRALLTSLFCMGTFVVLGSMFPILDPNDPQGATPAILTPEFLRNPWYYRYGYMWVALVALRQKYYFAWKNAEGASNIWYAGFDGFDDKGEPMGWENCVNINIIGFETASNIQTLSKEWNKKTSLWLTRYVYIRTGGSLAAVYSMSAFWHGFYPGYYLFFMTVPLITMVERIARKKISPHFSSASFTPYDFACRIATSFFVEYSVIAFALLALDNSIAAWKSHFFFGHIGCVVLFAIFSQLPTPPKKEKKA